MKISIIIPTYNSEAVIKDCLEGIISSKFTDYEIVIIDNISTDSTLEIVKKYTKKIIILPKNVERNHARNKGLKHAHGDIIVFIDSDNVMRSDSLQIIVDYLDKHSQVSAVTGRTSIEHPNTNFSSQYKNLYMHFILGQMPLNVTFLQGDIYAVRTCDAKKVDIETITDDTARGQLLHKANKTIHFLKDLQVIHLKKYNLIKLYKNDFIIPFLWARIFLKVKAWRQLGKGGVGYAHSPKEQLLSVILAPLIIFLTLLIPFITFSEPAFIFLILFWFLLNLKFFVFLTKERGIFFGIIKAIPVTFIDHIIMACGIMFGIAKYIIGIKIN